MNFADLVHSRFGHISHKNKFVNTLFRKVFGDDYIRASKTRSHCEACIYSKATRQSFPKKARRRATRPLERVWFDIIGKIPVKGVGGYQYVLVFVDEFTGMYFVEFLKEKSELYDTVINFKLRAEKHWHGKNVFGVLDVYPEIISLCSDNAGENTSHKLTKFLDDHHIKHQLMTPYEHEQMGKVERANRTIWEGSESIRFNAGFPANRWPDMVRTFVMIRNMLPNNMNKLNDGINDLNKTPYEIWHNYDRANFKQLTKHFRVPGCTAYAFIPNELRKRTSKRVIKCVFLGYADDMKACTLLTLDGSRFNARNVYFNETEYPYRNLTKSNDDVMDNTNLISFLKSYPVSQQISDEFDIDEPIADVVDNINPLSQLERNRRIDLITTSNNDSNVVTNNNSHTNDSDNDEIDNVNDHDTIENTDDRSIEDIIYDEIEEQNRDVGSTVDTVESSLRSSIRKSTRNRNMSSLGLESLANSPSRRNRHIPLSESYEEMSRLAYIDESIDSIIDTDVCVNAMLVRDMIGKRIDLLTMFDDYERVMVTRVHDTTIPNTRKQMLKHKESVSYLLAERLELESFERLSVLKLVDRPTDKNVMKCGWVYDKKLNLDGNLIHKARLVAKGYSQVHGLDFFEVFSPTMQTKTFRSLLAIAANDSNVMTQSWDVSTAFLYAPMNEDVYVEQPDGHSTHGKNKVYKMMKSMYGTKQASRNWNLTVNNALCHIGFKQSVNDSCLYILRYPDGRFIYLLIHVDDFAVFHNDSKLCESVFSKLNSNFKLKRGPLNFFLGMRVCHYDDGSYSLDQEKYIDAILDRFNMSNCTSISTDS